MVYLKIEITPTYFIYNYQLKLILHYKQKLIIFATNSHKFEFHMKHTISSFYYNFY